MAKMEECMKAHPLLHTVTGVGVGLILAGAVPALLGNALMIGVVLVVLAVVGEFVWK